MAHAGWVTRRSLVCDLLCVACGESGSASGVAKLSAKQLAAAAETFATVQAKLSTSMSSGYGRLSPLKKSGLSISVGGDFLDSKTVDGVPLVLRLGLFYSSLIDDCHPRCERAEDIPYTDSITDAGSRILAEVGISFDVPDSDGEDAEKQRTQGGSSFAALEASRRRRKSRDIQIPLDDTLVRCLPCNWAVDSLWFWCDDRRVAACVTVGCRTPRARRRGRTNDSCSC